MRTGNYTFAQKRNRKLKIQYYSILLILILGDGCWNDADRPDQGYTRH